MIVVEIVECKIVYLWVGGYVNVFVFLSFEVGNIGYKFVEWIGCVKVVGLLL